MDECSRGREVRGERRVFLWLDDDGRFTSHDGPQSARRKT